MPLPRRHLRLNDVRDTIRQRCFSPESPCQVGVELEWLTVADDDPRARVDPPALTGALAAAGAPPGGSSVTFEPGGQLELSSPPHPTVAQACAAAAADVAWANAAAAGAGLHLVGLGADPLRPARRVVASPRYDAMEAYFDNEGPAGRRMMCNTAAVQVNVGVGPSAEDAARQWRVAQRLGPTLAAAFANSPLLDGHPTGFRSVRLATWLALDRSRAAPVDSARPGPDAWADYVLDAQVMLIRAGPAGPGGAAAHEAVPGPAGPGGAAAHGAVPGPAGPGGAAAHGAVAAYEMPAAPMSFGQWVSEGHDLGWPSDDDLDYHLSTLFPPVRPRGWLELRMIDVLPDPWWQVPVAVVTALLTDAEAGDAAERAARAAGATGRWLDAARTGVSHLALASSARQCFAAALAGLGRLDAGTRLVDLVATYADRWIRLGRCPADDRLDAWVGDGVLFPEPVEARA